MSNRYEFTGRVAVITGGGQGIGLAAAERIYEGGGALAIWDLDPAVMATLDARFDADRLLKQPCDISDLASVEAARDATLARFGKIDVLINNAAMVGPNATTWDYPVDAFEQVVQVGLMGTYYVSRTVVPHMIAAGYGRIVNVASIAGKEGNPNAPAYSATKAGVIALTKSLGKELAKYDIAVNAVTPAVARTVAAMEQSEEHIAYMLSRIPRGRMLDLTEAGAMIAWLCTAENSFTTGSVFDLSGGRATY